MTAGEAGGEHRENSHFVRAGARFRQNGARAFHLSRRDKNPFPPRADSLFGATVAPAPDCDYGLSGLGFHTKSRQGNLKFMTAVDPRESLAVQRENDHYRERCRAAFDRERIKNVKLAHCLNSQRMLYRWRVFHMSE